MGLGARAAKTERVREGLESPVSSHKDPMGIEFSMTGTTIRINMQRMRVSKSLDTGQGYARIWLGCNGTSRPPIRGLARGR